MTNLVEVLGIFFAIVTFPVASGVVALTVTDFWQGLAWAVLLLAGAIGFFVLVRFVIRGRRAT